MYDMEYYTKRLQCNENDKRAAMKTVQKLYTLAQLARKNGLLVLEAAMENETDLFLQKSVMLIVDATDPERVQATMERYIMAGDYFGKDFLEKVIIMAGVLSIQQGENPTYLVESLGGWFGLEFQTIYESEVALFMPKPAVLPVKQHTTKREMSIEFDIIAKLDSRSIQRLIRELNAWEIGAALYCADDIVLQHFMNNMSENTKEAVIQEMNDFQDYQINASRAARSRIADTARNLEKRGELIIIDKK